MSKFLISALLVSLLAACSSEEVKDESAAPVESRSTEADAAAAGNAAAEQSSMGDADALAAGTGNQLDSTGLNDASSIDGKAVDGKVGGAKAVDGKPGGAKTGDGKLGKIADGKPGEGKVVGGKVADVKAGGGAKPTNGQIVGGQQGGFAGQPFIGQNGVRSGYGQPNGGQQGGGQFMGVPSGGQYAGGQQSGGQHTGSPQGGSQYAGGQQQHSGGSQGGGQQGGGKQAGVPQRGGLYAGGGSQTGGGQQDGNQIDEDRQGDASMGEGMVKTAKPLDPRLKDPNNILSHRRVYYDMDKYDVSEKYRPMIEAHAKFLNENPDANVIVQGNCDERGSREYNIALGHRRAEGVRKMLTVLGAPDKQIETVSFGEEKPLPSITCHDESCWKENRRSDLVYQGE